MILVPVKNLDGAKQRLAAVLEQAQRTELARAMLEDVLDAVAQCPARPPVSVVTGDGFARELAARHGFEVIEDAENGGESVAIEMATAVCVEHGARFTLVLPGDIPLITGEEVAAVLAAAPGEGSVIVPSADFRGSNAVLRQPGALFPLRFGNDSFLPHRAAAEATGKPCVILELPGIALDVDRPGDLLLLLRRKVTTRAQRLLHKWQLGRRWKMPVSRLMEVRKAQGKGTR
jgi:2-phospho-L-lactate guanylyltransferase